MYTLTTYFQQDFTAETLITIVAALLALAVGWLILRFVLKIAWRAFAIGCAGILILGVCLAAAAFFRGP